MSGMCGWIGHSPAPEDSVRILDAMAYELTRFDRSHVQTLHDNRYGLAVAAAPGRASSAKTGNCAAVTWGTPLFLDEDLDAKSRASSPALAAIDAFRRYGSECCSRIRGGFALAIVDAASGNALLSIDRMGIYNLVYTEAGDSLLFASTANALHRHPSALARVDWQSIYHYVHFHMVPGPSTAFENERRLLPGEYIYLEAGNLRLGRYWRPRFIEDQRRPFLELRDEFLSTLTNAVRRMAAQVPTGAFLSGGTDSSTVSGLLGEVTGRPAETFSIGFAEPGYDEMEYARIAARHFKTAQHEYYVTPKDIVDTIPKLGLIFDGPFGNSSAVPTYCCAKLARDMGVQLMLGGDGGDELFGGNERYATQYWYSMYEKLPRSVRRRLLEPLSRILPNGSVFPPLRWYRRLIELASTPMPDRTDAHNLLLRIGPNNIFAPEFLANIDSSGPSNLMRDVYSETRANSLINRMLGYDFRFTLYDSDLPKVMKSCELAGIPVDFPMLDDELVAFSTVLAPDLKLKGTKLRYFFKQALSGFLPSAIITKTKHGFGLPFGPWLRSYKPLEELVIERLRSLRGRGFIRSDFLGQLMASHLQEHPGYYGTMAWILIMLEEWFQQHVDNSPYSSRHLTQPHTGYIRSSEQAGA